jgi:hypothetical protein
MIFALLLAACAPASPAPAVTPPAIPETAAPLPDTGNPTEEPPSAEDWRPQPGDEKLNRAEVNLTAVELRVRESFPPQNSLYLAGEKGNPCNQLRVNVLQPNAGGEIQVDVYTVYDIAATCLQVLETFEIEVPLEGPAGEYTVSVNGEPAGKVTFVEAPAEQ